MQTNKAELVGKSLEADKACDPVFAAVSDSTGHGSGDLEGCKVPGWTEPDDPGRAQGPALCPLVHQPHQLRPGLAWLLRSAAPEFLRCVEQHVMLGSDALQRLLLLYNM